MGLVKRVLIENSQIDEKHSQRWTTKMVTRKINWCRKKSGKGDNSIICSENDTGINERKNSTKWMGQWRREYQGLTA